MSPEFPGRRSKKRKEMSHMTDPYTRKVCGRLPVFSLSTQEARQEDGGFRCSWAISSKSVSKQREN